MSTNKKPTRPQVRRLKVRYLPGAARKQHAKATPQIALSGQWLQKIGFEYGDNILVTAMNSLLIIRAEGAVAR